MASSIHLHFAGGGLCSLSLPSITKHFELEAGESQGLTARLGSGGGLGGWGEHRLFPTPTYVHHSHSPKHTCIPSETQPPMHHYTHTHFFFLIDCPFNHGQNCLVDGKVHSRHVVDPVSKETSLLSCLMESPQHTTKQPPSTGSHLP